MRKIRAIIYDIFGKENFRSYRKSTGGIWYKVIDHSLTGWGPIKQWTQQRPPTNSEFLQSEKIECYSTFTIGDHVALTSHGPYKIYGIIREFNFETKMYLVEWAQCNDVNLNILLPHQGMVNTYEFDSTIHLYAHNIVNN